MGGRTKGPDEGTLPPYKPLSHGLATPQEGCLAEQEGAGGEVRQEPDPFTFCRILPVLVDAWTSLHW